MADPYRFDALGDWQRGDKGMIQIIRRLLKLAGKDAVKIKLGFLFGFLESIFSALPLIAVYLILQEMDPAMRFLSDSVLSLGTCSNGYPWGISATTI